MICWIDVETTGLNPRKELLLEVAAVMTNDALVEIEAFTAVVSNARVADMNKIDPYVQLMHATNGLWNESILSGLAQIEVDDMLSTFIQRHCPEAVSSPGGAKAGPQLGGSSINFDREFLELHLPRAHSFLHRRNIDVSTMNELARRFWPGVWEGRPKGTESTHRALADIRHSVAVARHYALALGPTATVTL